MKSTVDALLAALEPLTPARKPEEIAPPYAKCSPAESEVAKLLGVSSRTVQRYRAKEQHLDVGQPPPIEDLGVDLDEAFAAGVRAVREFLGYQLQRVDAIAYSMRYLALAPLPVPPEAVGRMREAVNALRSAIVETMPHSVCPYCKGVDGVQSSCTHCKGFGWVASLDGVPEALLDERAPAVIVGGEIVPLEIQGF